MKYFLLLTLLILNGFLVGCTEGVNSPKGFSLPQGNVQNGQAVFIKYQCQACHQLAGFEQAEALKPSGLTIQLGGETTQIKTYAELVTSVINPSHKLAQGYPDKMLKSGNKSKMKVYNDVMTVTELVDLVTFLETKYELAPYELTSYKYLN